MVSQLFQYLKLTFRLVIDFLLLPFLIIIEVSHSIFAGRFRKFDGQTVLITGAGNGLGREMALQLAQKQCKVLCVDMKAKDVNETVQVIETEYKGYAKSYICDITDRSAVETLRDSVLSEFGKIDLLVNNAAFLYLVPFMEGSDDHYRRCFDVNILGTIWMTRAFLPSMKRQESGQILFINSISAIATEVGMCAYGMTKSALLSLAWSLRDELDSNPKWKSIKISSALPWFIDTHPAYRNFYKNNFLPMTMKYTAARALEGARRGFTEFSIPGGQLGTRILFLITRVLPRSFIKFIKPSLGVEIGRLSDESLFEKFTSPDYTLRDPELLKEQPIWVKFSTGDHKAIWPSD